MTETQDRVGKALARFDRVMTVIDEKQGAVATAARRERQRDLRRYGKAVRNAALAVLFISMATIGIGLVTPIGLFGFLAAVGLAIAVFGLLLFWGSREDSAPLSVPADGSNAVMLQRLDSYLYRTRRALPAPAQTIVDGISAELANLKTTLDRTDPIDPDAQDARRLMSVHLPGLIDRYSNVPTAYRATADGEGKTVDQRLVEGLAASRAALSEISERLAKRDLDAFSTQGRFIENRYGPAGEG